MSRTTPPTRRIYISSFSHQREEKTKKFYSHQGSNRVMDTYLRFHVIDFTKISETRGVDNISLFFYLIAALYLICLAPSLVRHHHHHRVVCSCCCMYHTAPCSFLPKRKKGGRMMVMADPPHFRSSEGDIHWQWNRLLLAAAQVDGIHHEKDERNEDKDGRSELWSSPNGLPQSTPYCCGFHRVDRVINSLYFDLPIHLKKKARNLNVI